MATGKEFDFYGETAKVSNAINEEQMIFQRQAPKKATPKAPPKPQTPLPTDPIPDLKPEMSLWQSSMPAQREEPIQYQYQRPIEQFSLQQSGPKKFMSLEEVEAQILARSSHQHVSSPPAQPQIRNLPPLSQPAQLQQFHQEPNSHAAHIHQLLQQSISPPPPFPLDHRSSPQGLFNHLQNPQNVPHGVPIPAGGVPLLSHQTHQSEMERVRMLEDESKKLKRNHKIAQLVSCNYIPN